MATYKPHARKPASRVTNRDAAVPQNARTSTHRKDSRASAWKDGFQYTRDLLAVLSARAGQLVSLREIVAAIGRDPDVQSNRVDAICELCRQEELGKINDGWIGAGPDRQMAWMMPAPPEEMR